MCHPVKALPPDARRLDPNAITPWREGRIAIRVLPEEQTVEDWQDAWAEFKEA